MSLNEIIQSINSYQQHFYLSEQSPCPYFDDRAERQFFTILDNNTMHDCLDALNQAGFRRSQTIMYRPACPHCTACIPIRIDVAQFQWRTRWRRIIKKNADLTLHKGTCFASEQARKLFTHYLEKRHQNSIMADDPNISLELTLVECPKTTKLWQFSNSDRDLMAAVIVDDFSDGLSAVYSFFAPEQPRRSLGSYIILSLIEQAAIHDLPYVYLGYWIKDHPKMDYKKQFQPLQYLASTGWKTLR
ncbi:MAG: arginyltransferase [Pseudomonadota bacterium]